MAAVQTSPTHATTPHAIEAESETMPPMMRQIRQYSLPHLYHRYDQPADSKVKAPMSTGSVSQEVSAIEQLRELKLKERTPRRQSCVSQSFSVKRREPAEHEILESVASQSESLRVHNTTEAKPSGPLSPAEAEGSWQAENNVTTEAEEVGATHAGGIANEPATAGIPSHPTEGEFDPNADYDAGMLWIIKNNKMIVSGFVPGSLAPKKGVKPGDILRAIDKKDILSMSVDDQGHHEGEELLLGPPKTKVNLTFLRVSKPQEGESVSASPLLEYHVTLPRSLAVGP